MEQNAAAEHLQVIRTLMERSALYRRRLAPIMSYLGMVGVLAGAGGVALEIEAPRAFCAWWLGTAVAGVAGAFTIAWRQALDNREPLWSPPALRLTYAVVPPLTAGLLLSVALLVFAPGDTRRLFVPVNALFYGCAVHAAGFFVPRGLRIFGWLFIALGGSWLFVPPSVAAAAAFRLDHAVMGALFGLLHLACGAYLYATEPRKTA